MELLKRITIDPHISHGKPTIRGLRYPVESILEYLTGGDTIEDILAEFEDFGTGGYFGLLGLCLIRLLE